MVKALLDGLNGKAFKDDNTREVKQLEV
ncbi:MAG: hypothetical protein KIC98_06285 [Clostridioides difficile]|nr:hypothetical protein [Clostridioides difficile]